MIEKMIERRSFGAEALDVAPSDTGLSLIGYASTWEAYDMGSFSERIEPAAFAAAIEGADVMALLNHDSSLPLARTTNGSLRLAVDDVGLCCYIDCVETSYSRDMVGLVKAGVLSSMSFGFRCLADTFEPRAGTTPLRIINELEIIEVSVVSFPANPGTSIDTRTLKIWESQQRSDGRGFYFCAPS